MTTVSGTLSLPAGLSAEVVTTGPNSIEIEGDLSALERARLIGELVSRGVAVCELSPQQTTLEEEFAKAVEEEEEEIPA